MITRPSTEQLILDCCAELTDTIVPVIDDETLRVGLVMTITVLRNTAARAAHEISWMHKEITAIAAFADRVLEVQAAPDLATARALLADGRGDRLDLDEVIEVYQRASRTLGCAVRTALRSGDEDLIGVARTMLHERLSVEREIMSAYDIVGR